MFKLIPILVLFLCAATPLYAADPVVSDTGAGTADEPSAVVHAGELYLFFDGAKYVKTAGAAWSAPMTVPFPVTVSCGQWDNRAVSFNNRLYVFGGCGGAHYVVLDENGSWSPRQFIPGASTLRTVAVAAFKGRLYAMWRAEGTNTSLFYSSMDANGNWSSTARLSTGESGSSPSAAVITADDGKQYLYAFWHDRYPPGGSNAQHMWYARMGDSLSWSSVQKLNTSDYPLTTHRPDAVSTPTGIYIAYKGGYNSNLVYKKLGTNVQWLTEVDTAWDVTDISPALAHFNGQTWLFYRYQYTSDGWWYVRYQIIN